MFPWVLSLYSLIHWVMLRPRQTSFPAMYWWPIRWQLWSCCDGTTLTHSSLPCIDKYSAFDCVGCRIPVSPHMAYISWFAWKLKSEEHIHELSGWHDYKMGHYVFLGRSARRYRAGISPTGGPDLRRELSSLTPVLDLVWSWGKALWRVSSTHSAFRYA